MYSICVSVSICTYVHKHALSFVKHNVSEQRCMVFHCPLTSHLVNRIRNTVHTLQYMQWGCGSQSSVGVAHSHQWVWLTAISGCGSQPSVAHSHQLVWLSYQCVGYKAASGQSDNHMYTHCTTPMLHTYVWLPHIIIPLLTGPVSDAESEVS